MVRGALIALLLVGLGVAGCGEEQPASRLQAGDQLPPLAVQDLDGRPRTLAAEPGRLLILNVWATWCAPCRQELPSLQRLAARLDPERFRLRLLSVDEDAFVVREFLIDREVRLESLLDPQMAVAHGVLGVRLFPSTYLVAPDGRIVELIEGERAWDAPDILARLESLQSAR